MTVSCNTKSSQPGLSSPKGGEQSFRSDEIKLHVSVRPQNVEQLIMGHQSSEVLDEIPQHIKSLGC